MRVVKIFVAGSIEGLDEERNKVLQIVSARNAQYAQLEKDIFILPISFKDFLIQSSQNFIDSVIKNEADIVIFLADGEKGGKCLGDFTKRELECAEEAHVDRNLIYKIFLKKSRNSRVDEEAEKALKDALKKIKKEDIKESTEKKDDNFWHDPIYMDIIIGGAIEKALLHPRPNAPISSWNNDHFAYLTIEARFKEIFKGIFKQNENDRDKNTDIYPYEVFLKEHYAECQTKDDNPLVIFARKEIEEILAKHKTYGIPNGELVRTIPFLDAEFYFYYYVLLKYIEKRKDQKKKRKDQKNHLYDPYYSKKRESDGNIDKPGLKELLDESYKKAIESNESARWLLHCCLSSNSSDLSQLDVNKALKPVQLALNDSNEFDEYIQTIEDETGDVHYIVDNSSIELYADILLGCYILHKTKIKEINYHVKKVPIFVGDTTINDDAINDDAKIDDVKGIIKYLPEGLNESETAPHTYTLTIKGETKTLKFTAEDAWSQPKEFNLSEEFKEWNDNKDVKLIVLKGDMNYRRLVGDRIYDLGDTIDRKIRYVEKPILILRSFKSSVILDVEDKKQRRWKPNWRTCGEFGIIQFVNPLGKQKAKEAEKEEGKQQES